MCLRTAFNGNRKGRRTPEKWQGLGQGSNGAAWPDWHGMRAVAVPRRSPTCKHKDVPYRRSRSANSSCRSRRLRMGCEVELNSPGPIVPHKPHSMISLTAMDHQPGSPHNTLEYHKLNDIRHHDAPECGCEDHKRSNK